MNKRRHLIEGWVVIATLALAGVLVLSHSARAQQRSKSSPSRHQTTAPRSAYERGYLAGYSDGYRSGKSDYTTQDKDDAKSSSLYQEANRGYEPSFGAMTDYQDGYRLGYEIAYKDGYYGRTSNSKVPPHALALKGVGTTSPQSTARPSDRTQPGKRVVIPPETELRLRLSNNLNTKTNHQGDSFTATVVEPSTYQDATVKGHIAKLDRSGKMTGRTEMTLDFDTVTLRGGRTGPFHAQIERIYANGTVKSVDEEGHIETASKTTDTEIRTAGGAGLGALIGVLAGGGKGAAIGAMIGAGVGAGSVYVQGNKDLILEPGTEMTVRTLSAASESPSRESNRWTR